MQSHSTCDCTLACKQTGISKCPATSKMVAPGITIAWLFFGRTASTVYFGQPRLQSKPLMVSEQEIRHWSRCMSRGSDQSNQKNPHRLVDLAVQTSCPPQTVSDYRHRRPADL